MSPLDAAALAGLRDELQQALVQMGVTLNATQVDQIMGHLTMLQKWNRVHNLTAIDSPQEALQLHALDCLATIPAWLQRRPAPASLLDVGSGAGFPAVTYAIAWPQTQVLAVDSVGKKAAFIQQVASQLGLKNLKSRHARVQDVKQSFEAITCRAFAALPDLVNWTDNLLAKEGRWVCLKGKTPLEEIQALPPHVVLESVDPVTVPGLEAQRCLVWLLKA
jgi:16S rRNA (guanine527-N7)-methyltransferase